MSSGSSFSSSGSLWIMVNQYQALLLIPLLNVYIPKNIRDFIVGNDVTMFSFSFLRIKDINFVTDLNQNLGGDQDDEYLNEIGIESNSVIINHISLFLVFLILFISHIVVWLMARLIRSKSQNKESK